MFKFSKRNNFSVVCFKKKQPNVNIVDERLKINFDDNSTTHLYI